MFARPPSVSRAGQRSVLNGHTFPVIPSAARDLQFSLSVLGPRLRRGLFSALPVCTRNSEDHVLANRPVGHLLVAPLAEAPAAALDRFLRTAVVLAEPEADCLEQADGLSDQ